MLFFKKMFPLMVLVSTSVFAQVNFIKDSLDTYLERELKRWNVPGLAIAIVKNGKVIHQKGYGYTSTDKKIPVTENTVFQIASVSKAFTGTSIALLEQYGKLKLNDKVVRYLPYFKMHEEWKTKEVTIADLLSHRIGYSTFQSDLLNWASNCTRRALIENMVNVVPSQGFRTRYGYCNVGFLTAGEIIPAVCDTSWDDYLTYHYFKPLGMTNTSTRFADFKQSKLASKGYTLFDGQLTEIIPANIDNIGPAGSISSSVNDLSKWIRMQLENGVYEGKEIVPAKAIARTRQSFMIVNPTSFKGMNFYTYGLGWFLHDAEGKKVVTHDGGATGFLSKVMLVPEENFGIVILSNLDEQALYEALGMQLLNDLLKQPYTNLSLSYHTSFLEDQNEKRTALAALRQKAQNYKVVSGAYTPFAGTYTNAVYGKISIEAKSSYAEILFQHHPQYTGKLVFTSATTFMLSYNDPSLGVKEVQGQIEQGKVTIEIKVNENLDGDAYTFTRIGAFEKFSKN